MRRGAAADETYLRAAIRLAATNRVGGPFGAVLVWRGTIVGRGRNRVTHDNDPTAHAEVVAIRAACRRLDRFHLTDAVLYTSCEPCPMCLAAACWARVGRIVYAASRHDAARAGFDDRRIYREVARPRRLQLVRALAAEGREPFRLWLADPQRIPY